jgi:hypothetical protein
MFLSWLCLRKTGTGFQVCRKFPDHQERRRGKENSCCVDVSTLPPRGPATMPAQELPSRRLAKCCQETDDKHAASQVGMISSS